MKVYKVKVNDKLYVVELESVTENNDSIEEVKVAKAVETVKGGADQTKVCAPMAGTIVKVSVNLGDTVKAGDCLVVLEAMKLENEIVAPVAGKVSQILVNKGATVNNQQVLVVIG